MTETTSQRVAREEAATMRLFDEVRAEVRAPVARGAHFATAFSDAAGREFRAKCRCGWQGKAHRYSGELPAPAYAVAEYKRRADLEARLHTRDA